jgi:hypothetical protein
MRGPIDLVLRRRPVVVGAACVALLTGCRSSDDGVRMIGDPDPPSTTATMSSRTDGGSRAFGPAVGTVHGDESVDGVQAQAIELEHRLRARPRDAGAWTELALARYSLGVSLTPEPPAPTTAATKAQFRRAAVAWRRTIALDRGRVGADLALSMAIVFDTRGLDDPAERDVAESLVVRAYEATARRGGSPVDASAYFSLLEAHVAAHRPRRVLRATERKILAATPVRLRARSRASIEQLEGRHRARAAPHTPEAPGGR